MTFHAADPAHHAQNTAHVALARRFWTPTEDFHGPLPASQSASGGHPGHAAVSDAPPSLADLRDARKRLRRLGVSLAGSAPVAAPRESPVPPVLVAQPSFVSFAAERTLEGPWGPTVWVVSNVVTGIEVARYPAHETDGPGAILRALQEELCWQERQRKGGAA